MPLTATAPTGSPDLPIVLERVSTRPGRANYEGYSKHDALNARWLERLADGSRRRRLAAIQLVMRSPVDVRRPSGSARPATPKASRCSPGRSWPAPPDRRPRETPPRPGDLLDWLVANPSLQASRGCAGATPTPGRTSASSRPATFPTGW